MESNKYISAKTLNNKSVITNKMYSLHFKHQCRLFSCVFRDLRFTHATKQPCKQKIGAFYWTISNVIPQGLRFWLLGVKDVSGWVSRTGNKLVPDWLLPKYC